MKIFYFVFMNLLLIANSTLTIKSLDFMLENIPWMAAIFGTNSLNISVWCPGVLISSTAVLASAQCIIVDLQTLSLQVHVNGQTTGVREIDFNRQNVIHPLGDNYAFLALQQSIFVGNKVFVNYPNKFDTIYYDNCNIIHLHHKENEGVFVRNIMNAGFYREYCRINSKDILTANDKYLCYGNLNLDQCSNVMWGSPVICPQFNYQDYNFENVIVGFTYRLPPHKACGIAIYNISHSRIWIRRKLSELSWENFINT